MTEQLKPCPCCGSLEAAIKTMNVGTYRVFCEYCRLCIPGCESRSEAIEKWNTRADGWISVNVNPQFSGRFIVESSYGVRDAFFTEGFISGDFRWQDCETGNDEGMEDVNGVEFKIYNWMPLPSPSAK